MAKSSIQKRLKTVTVEPVSPKRPKRLRRQQTPLKPKEKNGHYSVAHNKKLLAHDSETDSSLPDLPGSQYNKEFQINNQTLNEEGREETELTLTLDGADEKDGFTTHTLDLAILDCDKMSHDMMAVSLNKIWKADENCEECTVRASMQGMSATISALLDLFGRSLNEIRNLKNKISDIKSM